MPAGCSLCFGIVAGGRLLQSMGYNMAAHSADGAKLTTDGGVDASRVTATELAPTFGTADSTVHACTLAHVCTHMYTHMQVHVVPE